MYYLLIIIFYYIYIYIYIYIHTYIPTYLPTYLHTYLPTYLSCHPPPVDDFASSSSAGDGHFFHAEAFTTIIPC